MLFIAASIPAPIDIQLPPLYVGINALVGKNAGKEDAGKGCRQGMSAKPFGANCLFTSLYIRRQDAAVSCTYCRPEQSSTLYLRS